MNKIGKNSKDPSGQEQRPFYQPSSDVTAARIVSQARTSLRTLKTKRPITPLQSERTLLGDRAGSAHLRDSRPPSVMSISSRNFMEYPAAKPPPGKRLSPIEQEKLVRKSNRHADSKDQQEQSSSVSDEKSINKNETKTTRRHFGRLIRHVSSFDDVVRGAPTFNPINRQLGRVGSYDQVPTPPDQIRRGSLPSPSQQDKNASEGNRRVHSGPKERLKPDINGKTVTDIRPEVIRKASVTTDKHRFISSKQKSASSSSLEKVQTSSDCNVVDNTCRSSSASSTREKSSHVDDEDASYWERVLIPLLNRMDISKVEAPINANQIYQTSCYLWEALVRGGMLGRSSGGIASSKRRSNVLHVVYRLLDQDDPKLLLKLARIIFAMKVSGNNLGNICKLVYLVSRKESNDTYFMDEKIPECLFDVWNIADPLVNLESITYSAATIKFLSSNSNLKEYLFNLKCVEETVKLINSLMFRTDLKAAEISNVLIQLTAILANLADNAQYWKSFISSDVTACILPVLNKFSSESDLMLNVSRIFSKMTQYSAFCHILAKNVNVLVQFLKLMTKQIRKVDLVVRLCFVLGNIFLENEDVSMMVIFENNGLDYLLMILKTYLEWDAKLTADENEEHSKSIAKIEDVLVKVIWVIANLSIYYEIGAAISSSDKCIDYLQQILATKEISKSKEVIIHATVAMNNLSFYEANDNALCKKEIELAKIFVLLLLDGDIDIIVEVTRVLGNLSRSQVVRDLLVSKKVDEMMITLLDAGRRDVVYYSCGLLMNFMKSPSNRQKLRTEGGVKRLIDALRDFGRDDWQLAGLVCKTLWNYSVQMVNSYATFGEEETNRLMELLEDYLDEEVTCNYTEGDISHESQEMLKQQWSEEFVPVAKALLDKVEHRIGDLEPLE